MPAGPDHVAPSENGGKQSVGDDQNQAYLWRSTGGCQYCDAMSGYHLGREPKRPHPNCVCEVVLAKRKTIKAGRYEYWYGNWKYYEKRGSKYVRLKRNRMEIIKTVYIQFDYSIRCLHENRGKKGKIKIAQKANDWNKLHDDHTIPSYKFVENLYKNLYGELRSRIQAIASTLNCKATRGSALVS